MFTEQLESRRHFSVAASLGGDTLFVYGDEKANDFKVEFSDALQTEIVKVRTGPNTYTQIYSVADSKVKNIRIYGRGGDDHIDAGDCAGSSVIINGGHGKDWILAGGYDCLAFGNNDPLTTSQADDNASDTLIDGSGGDCSLYGQGGNDVLCSGLKNRGQGLYNALDLWGGPGNDTIDTRIGQPGRPIDAHGGSGNDLLRGIDSARFVNFHGDSGIDTVDFTGTSDDVVIRFDNTRDSGDRYLSSQQTYLLGSDVENATGGAGNDEILGSAANNVLRGGSGDDEIYGGKGNDTLYGDDGYDGLYGGEGNDFLHGGNDADILWGDSGNDFLYGDAGNDTYYIIDHETDYVIGDAHDSLGNGKEYIDVVVGLE
jgi:Ca2+-binding RTX toxin-like protein